VANCGAPGCCGFLGLEIIDATEKLPLTPEELTTIQR
jgi:hypothetical protein